MPAMTSTAPPPAADPGEPVGPEQGGTEATEAAPLTDGYAAAGMALALAGLLVPIVPSVAGLYLAAASARRIAADPERLTGESINAGTRVVAWLGLAWWCLLTLFVLAGVAGKVLSG